MHSLWKKCKHGMVLSSSLASYSIRQTMHLVMASSVPSAALAMIYSSVIVLTGSDSTIALGVALTKEPAN